MRIKGTLIVGGAILFLIGATSQKAEAGPPVSPTIVQFTSTTITATWGLSGATSGYIVDASTSSSFTLPLISSGSPSTSISTLTVSGLSPATTYFIRVGAIAGSTVTYANTIPSVIVTSTGSIPNAPTGLAGNAAGVSSITWTWNMVAGASAYNLYMASSPTTVIAAGISQHLYPETGLSTNTAYGRVVTAVVSGTESGLSSAAAAYTLAATPGVPTFSNIASSSATVTWNSQGNSSFTVYELDRSNVSDFSSGVITPIPLSGNFTDTTTTFFNLAPGTSYFYRVQAENGANIVTAFSPVALLVTSGTVASGSGLGSASIAPSSVQEASIMTTTVTFTVPASGMSAGGRVEIDLPSGWGPFAQNVHSNQSGYVSVLSGGFTVALSSQGVVLKLTSGFLSSGNTISVAFQNFFTNCPTPALPQAQWNIKSAMSSSDGLANLTTAAPSQSYITGPFQSVNFVPWSILTTAINQAVPLLLQASDSCGQPVTLSAPLTVSLDGLLPDQSTPDSSAQFSNASNFVATTTTTVINASTSTAVFYYRTAAAGNGRWIRGSYFHPIYGVIYQVWRQLNVLSQSFAFNNASVDNGTAVAAQTTLTLSPDSDGINDAAYIRFTPSDPNTAWHVAISSNGFQYNVFEAWGSGSPLGRLLWNGQDTHTNSVVPNGTYGVKLEDLSGITSNTTLSIAVNTSMISGQVLLGGSPVAGAMVNANGTTAGSYASARTDASGNYTIYGLKAGSSYNLNVSFVNAATQAQISGQLPSVAAPAANENFALSSPGLLRISAVLPTPSPATVFGSINLYNNSSTAWGNIRLLAGTTTSDNGDPFNPSTWSILGVPPGSYTMHMSIQGYGVPDQSVTVSANATTDIVLNLTARANVYGYITLPAPAAVATWVPIQATLQGSNAPSAYGGASFNVGMSSAIYSLFAVSSGTYQFLAQPAGFIPLSSTVVVGLSDIGNQSSGGLDFSGFSVGGNISGSITINGDTTSQPISPMPIWISAFSPQLGQNAFTQTALTTDPVQTVGSYTIGGLADGTYQVNPPYLSGFSGSPPGPQSVVVSGGVGHLNITLNANTGKITGAITLPNGNSDYGNVHFSLQGPINQEVDASASTYLLNRLDTGYYSLIASYLTTGAQVNINVGVTNGQTQNIPIDLSLSTYSVSGTVSVQSGFTMTASSGAVVTINTISDLLAAATQQTVILGGTQNFAPTSAACSGGTPTVLTTARVEAFPKNFNSFNQANRSGFTNCFGVNQYKYNPIAADGSYTISGLTPGIWEIDVYPYFDSGSNPNVAVQTQIVSILGSNITGTNFALAGGNSVSGTVNLPTGVTDVRTISLQVQTDRGDTVQSTLLNIGTAGSPAASAAFSFSHLAAGSYALVFQDPGTFDTTLNRNVIRYVAKPVQFQITGGDLSGVTLTASNASRIVGKIAIQGANPDGTSSLILITPNNTNLLSSNFSIQAQADPWVPSGSAQASPSTNGGGVGIDSNNQFSIDGMIAGTYDVSFQQFSFGPSTLGSINLAAYTQGGVILPQGQTLDLGTITLQPGLVVSGLVTDTQGVPLSNIQVQANPSNNQNGSNGQAVFTNSLGQFTFSGLSPVVKIYDFKAAPHANPNENIQPVPYGQITKRAVDVTQVPPPSLSFALPSATAGFSGSVVTVDSGPLSFPDGDQSGYPEAAIYVNLEGNTDADNPLGDENATALDGSFSITNLPAGIYDLTVESLGYRPYKLTGVTLSSTMKALPPITLQRGPSLTATLTKPDGSAVNTTDVQQAVAASADLSSIIFGQINSDAQTNNIVSIKFAGFELSPKTYSILLFDSHNNIIVPADGKGLLFLNATDALTKALTFQPTAPLALANVQKSGSNVLVTFYFSRPLRNGVADQDPTTWLTRAAGQGTLSNIILSGDRRQLTATYMPAAGEQNATLQFNAHTVDIDASTGVEFVISKSVLLLLGQKATAEQSINAALGGNVSLSDALDTSKVSIPANALLNSGGSAADATAAYTFTLSATDDASSVGAGSLIGAPRVSNMMARGPAAYLSESYAAMREAKAEATVNPLSSFYSILLPAGLSHTLNQTASLTLNYDTGADPSLINIYFYNGTQYLIEQNQRTIDPVNHTITVAVSHFSTFVVLQNNLPVILVNGDTNSGGDIDVFNFPNPFDLQTKTKTLSHAGAATSITTDGTVIRYSIPAAMGGPAKIDIYNIIGEKVRSLDLGVPLTDTFNYVAWDGRNSSGKQVASGVYIGMLKVGGNKKFFKMAVIK